MLAFSQWDATWYKLEISKRMLPTMDPSVVPFVPLTFDAVAQRVWPKPLPPPRARRWRAGGGGRRKPLEAVAVAIEDPSLGSSSSTCDDGSEDTGLAVLLDEAAGAAYDRGPLGDAPIFDVADADESARAVDEGGGDGADEPHALVLPGYGSAGDPPLFVRGAPPAPEALAVLPRVRAPYSECSAYIHGSRISFFASKFCFEAHCPVPAHGKCVLTRTCRYKKGRVGGRPLGFLASWLEIASMFDTKAEHFSAEALMSITLEQRRANRVLLHAVEGGLELLDKEREKAPGEDSEATDLDGYK